MTDTPAPADATALPPLWQAIVRAIAQKGLASLATLLTTYGVIGNDQQSQLISLGLSVALWGASFAWTMAHERAAQKRMKVALATPPADPTKGQGG